MSNVVYLQKPPPQIVHFLRVGYREHVMVDRLRSEGNLQIFASFPMPPLCA